MEVYIINKMIRAAFPRECLRDPARWMLGRKAFQAEGVREQLFRGVSGLAYSGKSKEPSTSGGAHARRSDRGLTRGQMEQGLVSHEKNITSWNEIGATGNFELESGMV